jgi:hypothetical protein
MRQLALVVTLCFAFVVVGHADRCSDLCNECRKSKHIGICCQAENACYENGRQKCGEAKDKCKSLEGVGESGDNYDNNQYFPAFNERDVRRDVEEGVGRAIHNYQQNLPPFPQQVI